MSDPFAPPPSVFGDPFGSPSPSSRRGGLLSGLKGHVSSAHVDHLQQMGNSISNTARSVGGDVFDSAVGFAASNPDKMEKIGERVGQAAGASMVSPIIGGKAGGSAGKKLGGFLSKKAKERQGGAMQQPTSSPPPAGGYDPFS